MGPPVEPMAACSVLHLVIMSVHRMAEPRPLPHHLWYFSRIRYLYGYTLNSYLEYYWIFILAAGFWGVSLSAWGFVPKQVNLSMSPPFTL